MSKQTKSQDLNREPITGEPGSILEISHDEARSRGSDDFFGPDPENPFPAGTANHEAWEAGFMEAADEAATIIYADE